MNVAEFNKTVFELIEDLSGILPDESSLGVAKLLLQSMIQIDPNNIMLVKGYEATMATVKNKEITSENVLRILRGVVPDPSLVDTVWSKLTPENQQVVMEYVHKLYNIAEKKNAKTKLPPPVVNDGILEMYNQMWMQLLENLPSFETAASRVRDRLKTSSTTRWLLEQSQEWMKPVYFDISPEKMDQISAIMLPPTNAQETIDKDQDRLDLSKGFFADPKRTIGDFFEDMLSSENPNGLVGHWHFVKLMTTMLSDCPPEVMSFLGGIVGQLLPTLRDASS